MADVNSRLLAYHKFFPEVVSLEDTREEDNISPAERQLSWYFKWGIENEGDFHQPLQTWIPSTSMLVWHH